MPAKQLSLTLAMGLLAALTSAAQPPAAPERFEVASVKLIPPGRDSCCFSMSPWGGATFTANNVSLPVLIEIAFGVADYQISGMDRLGSELYDVSAKPENGGALTFERAQPMLKALLEERFKLVAHREMKDIPGYALTIATGGPKLKENAEPAGQGGILPGRLIGPASTLSDFAFLLAHPLGKPVVDKTGLEGKFSIDLKFAPEGDTNSSRPSIFTAIQEQLGLKLESRKIPFEMLVIDHCERVPTEN